jgi:tRNA-2-methylthio-N6-dimethylallyladenosine synthase
MYQKYYIFTWGCQMNEHKSEGIAGVLARAGFVPASDPAHADVVIFNTCMVREKPEDKVYSEAGVIGTYKAQKPELLLGVGGCVAQALKEKLFQRSDEIDFVFGSSNITDIPRLIEEARQRRRSLTGRYQPVMAVDRIADRIEDLPFLRVSPFQAKVTITEGCSNFCSFCIVPYTTGLLRSRRPGQVIAEVSALAGQGYREVQLLGQNVDSYGKDMDDPAINFANLLRALTRLEIPRIRFTSSHPQDITPDVIRVMGEPNNICEHLHMAVQSGSDRVLQEMRRGYTQERFLQLVRDLREGVPGVNITTDIIVGYPTESETDFEQTVDLVREARFGGAYIFKYSPRPGTISFYKFKPEQEVPDGEKQRRLGILLKWQKQITLEENQKRIGQTVEVLAEGPARAGDPQLYLGKTRDNKAVVFRSFTNPIGHFVNVRVREATIAGLAGEIERAPISIPLASSA